MNKDNKNTEVDNTDKKLHISDVSDDFVNWFEDRESYLKQYKKIQKELGNMCNLTKKELEKYCKGREISYDDNDIDDIQNVILDNILDNMEGIENYC